VTLPLVDEPPQTDAGPSATEPIETEARSILLVDDSDGVRRIAKSILERAGHRVTAVSSVSEAIQWMTNAGEVDLVITDVVMPKESGAALIAWLREEMPEVCVLVISGYTEDEQLKRGMRTGELPFLRKPFTSTDLLDATRRVLENGATRRG
jgi:two-component system cell cycle sensor histidine kinase/response regulator CckA